jgi:hypothetical protein
MNAIDAAVCHGQGMPQVVVVPSGHATGCPAAH